MVNLTLAIIIILLFVIIVLLLYKAEKTEQKLNNISADIADTITLLRGTQDMIFVKKSAYFERESKRETGADDDTEKTRKLKERQLKNFLTYNGQVQEKNE